MNLVNGFVAPSCPAVSRKPLAGLGRLTIVLAISVVMQAATPPLVPLLWTQGQPEETIRRVVREVADGGNTGFVWESRPHPDYLGPKWWADLGVAIDEASKLGLEVWIFDEWMYPSGVAGGKVVAANPAFALHTIEDRSIAVQGPVSERDYTAPDQSGGGQVLSAVAMPDPPRPGVQPIKLSPALKLRWAVPDGKWRIVWVIARSHPPLKGWKMDNMIDVMNPEATAAFIRITHEPTYQRFKKYFGTTIKGFFSDETGFRNITSYDSLPGKPGMRMPWSPALPAYFKRLKGYDLEPELASLWYDGPKSRMVRYDFVDVCSRAFAEHFFKPQQEWCRKHGVRLIGHLVEDNHADHNLGYGPGHWFRSERYLDMPGIDVVGFQVTPGVDSGMLPWVPSNSLRWDQEFFSFGMPAMARGAALMQGTREIFSEAFGAYGWNEGLRMVKWIGDWHIVNGISVLSPHAVTMKYNDPDCPPHFNRTSGTPQWRYYDDWAKPFSRLARMVAETDPVYDAAVLYTAESRWVGEAQTADATVRALETHQVSTVVLPYEALAEPVKVEGGKWLFRGQRFRSVVLPKVRLIPAYAAKRLAELADAGVRVTAIDAWPSASVDGRDDAAVTAAVSRLQRAGRVGVTFDGGRVTVQPASSSLVTAFRKCDKGEWLILHNRSLEKTVTGKLSVDGAAQHAARFDAESDRFVTIPHRMSGKRVELDIDMPPYSLWCVRLTSQSPQAEAQPVYRTAVPLQVNWQISKATDDAARQFAPLASRGVLSDWVTWPDMAKYSGTVRYRASIRVDDTNAGLDLGTVEEIAELTVNGRNLGVRLCPPYRWNLEGVLRKGENEVIVDVTNTGYARWKDTFSHGKATGGLMGPVQLLKP